MTLNFAANFLGLDSAATPFGLKAMQSLQELNPEKDKASDAQIMFMCLHAAGLTLIPTSIIGYRAAENASNPADVMLPCIITSFSFNLPLNISKSFLKNSQSYLRFGVNCMFVLSSILISNEYAAIKKAMLFEVPSNVKVLENERFLFSGSLISVIERFKGTAILSDKSIS
jgi:hypothetical protein